MKYILTSPIACTCQGNLYLLVAGEVVEVIGGVNNHTLLQREDRIYSVRDSDLKGKYRVLERGEH